MLDTLLRLPTWELVLLVVSLTFAFGFEFVNGFHDAANAVATVIYTRSLRPTTAVIWSGMWNFLGTLLGGISVAYAIVHLLPVEALINMNSHAGIAMVLSLLGAAILWNLGTWYFGIPASSSHTLIGSIIGVGMAHSFMRHGEFLRGVNLTKLEGISLSLLISPLVGFFCSGVLLLMMKWWRPNPNLHRPPEGGAKPPGWIRGVLIGTCTGVSFAHGSNDGQKGMGLIMLILIGLLPAQFALNLTTPGGSENLYKAMSGVNGYFLSEMREAQEPGIRLVANTAEEQQMFQTLVLTDRLSRRLASIHTLEEIPEDQRWQFRQSLFEVSSGITTYLASHPTLPAPQKHKLQKLRSTIRGYVEYVPMWVIIGVALCLGIGTTIGWKRIVVTVGEKIGKSHLTYGQGATAELVAMSTIGLADVAGLPVSTTHVLSSGVAGTMWANQSGVNFAMVRTIALAWILTIPMSILLSGGLYYLLSFVF